jgi:tetratricopeptide (TPR) repeat protein
MEKRSMKLVSKTALGLALALGSVSMAAIPAQAQKKPKEEAEKPKQLKLSKEFREAAGPIDKAYKAQDWPGTLAAIDAAEPAAKAPDEVYFLNQYRLDAATKSQNVIAQEKALGAMLASGMVPPADVGKYHFFAGKFASDRKDYAKAEAEYTAAAAANYVNTDLYLSQAKIYADTGRYQQVLAALEKALAAETAAGRKPPEDWYKFGFGQAYKGKLNNEVTKWTIMHVKAYPTPENWRTALIVFRDSQNPTDKPLIDLYRLMLASDSLAGEKDHYEYAYLASRAGLPGEAKMVLDHLKASKSPGTSPDVAELHKEVTAKAASDKASLAAEEKGVASAANGVGAAGVANAYLGYGDYAKAVSLYELALTKGGVDADEVNTRLGIALARQGQKDAAKAAFAKVQAAPRSGIAQYWAAWIDTAA